MEDIKKKIGEIINKIKNDKSFGNNFKKDPIKAVESVIGVDLPDDKIKAVVDGVKAKLTSEDMKDKASNLVDKVKGLF